MPRRSTRKTKGVNKKLEKEYELEDKTSGTGTPDNEVVRCLVCGTTDLNYDSDTDDRVMVQCDDCDTWQHAQCMLGREKRLPKKYKCEECDPSKYPDLKLAIPYAEYRKERFGDEEDPEVKEEDVEEPEEPEEPGDDSEDDPIEKPKHAIESDEEVYVRPIKRKRKTKKEKRVDASTKARESAIKQFVAKFRLKRPNGDADKWGEDLEEALFKAFPPVGIEAVSKDYLGKFRTLLYNLGNAELMDKIEQLEYDFDAVVKLRPDQMMADKIKKIASEVKKQSFKQTILHNTEEKVKIRRTHRGEEIIEEPEFNQKSVEDQRLEEIDKLRDAKQKKIRDEEDRQLAEGGLLEPQRMKFTVSVENDDDDEDERSGDDVEDDDFDKILNSTAKLETPKPKAEPKPEPVPTADEDDYDPFTIAPAQLAPQTTVSAEPVLWTGSVSFPMVCQIGSVKCTFVASTSRDGIESNRAKVAQTIVQSAPEGDLFIAGRLSAPTADGYLAKVIQSRDLYLAELRPSDELVGDQAEENLFHYTQIWGHLNLGGKYGVVAQHPDYVKDTYVISLTRDNVLMGKVPQFMTFFDRKALLRCLDERKGLDEHEITEKKLFLLYVIKKGLAPGPQKFNQSLDEIMHALAG